MGSKRERKDRPPASRKLRRAPAKAQPSADAWLEVTEEHEENFRPQTRERLLSLPNESSPWANLSDADLADDLHDAADRERIRKAGAQAIPYPYWENAQGVSAEPPFPDQLWDFALSRTEAKPFLLSLIHDQWLPLAWEVYASAGLPNGALVYVQTPDGQWLPEDGGRKVEGASCPAWRIPWAFRCEFSREYRDPAYIAADLLQVAVALLEHVDPTAPKLRERFSVFDEGEPLRPVDLPVLVAHGAWKFAALCHHAGWERDPRGSPPSSTYEGALAQRVNRYGHRDPQLVAAAQRIREEIEAGLLDRSKAAAARRLREIRHYSENYDLSPVIDAMIDHGELPDIRRPAGRPPKSKAQPASKRRRRKTP